jgi:hypothetical protein
MKLRLYLCVLMCLAVASFSRGVAAQRPAVVVAEPDTGFKDLFNGHDLSGWSGDPKFWKVADGMIVGQTTAQNPTSHNTFLIWRDGKLDDFELRLKFRIVGGNSGIQYRSVESPDWVVKGYQADFEAGKTCSGIVYEEGGRGILAQRGQKVVLHETGRKEVLGSVGDSARIQEAILPEQWNDYTIIARGNYLVHKINGITTAEAMDDDDAHRSMSGVLALQLHAGEPMTVQFKEIKLQRMRLSDSRRKIVLVAGHPSHGPGEHEFNAGVQLLNKYLQGKPNILTAVYLNGWPNDPTALDNADAVLLYMDGGAGHPAIKENHLDLLNSLARKGVGIGCAHFAVEVPPGVAGRAFQELIGGYYEHQYSVNPMWEPEYKSFPTHPVTRGVKPFSVLDEWYFNMRWGQDMKGITPILVAKPSDKVRGGPYVYPPGPYDHIKAASGRDETMMWVFDRPDGGRSFGFTGGHRHQNWGNDNFRKVVLNALLWIAKVEVPADGVESTVTPEDLTQNLDPKGKKP